MTDYAIAYSLGLVILVGDAGIVLTNWSLFERMRTGRMWVLGVVPVAEIPPSETYMQSTDWRR